MERSEAIEIVRKNYPHVSGSGTQFETALRTLIPELKESEDERIRNLIYCLIRDRSDNGRLLEHNGCSVEKALAWLEKQGNTKMSAEALREGVAHYGITQYQIDNWLKKYVEVESTEPKSSAWSEEDEERLNSIIESYKDLLRDYKACHDVDYIPYDSSTVVRTVVNDVNYLKSLKERYTWKPSDEQMECLLNTEGVLRADSRIAMAQKLSSLYNDLKKLTE